MNLKQSLLFTLELNQKTNIKHSVSHQSLLICKSVSAYLQIIKSISIFLHNGTFRYSLKLSVSTGKTVRTYNDCHCDGIKP